MFVLGQSYRRREIHETYGGQRQGGISTPAQHPLILLFTGDSGEQYGYHDGWQSNGLFYYTGEGQTGDMQMVRGNAAILQHAENGKDLLLFSQAPVRSFVKYEGQFVCIGRHSRKSNGLDGVEREAIVFELAPIDQFREDEPQHQNHPERVVPTLEELRARANEAAADERQAAVRLTLARHRSADVRRYVLRRADGTCEGCRLPAPFQTQAGEPYLETHHIRRLSDGGPDVPRWVVGLCANCHRRAHQSADAVEFNRILGEFVGRLERLN